MNNIRLQFAAVLLVLFNSCSSDKSETMEKPLKAPKADSSDENIHPGKLIYMQFCLACHMHNGEGVPGLYPPLGQTDHVLGDKNRLIKTMLNGQEGLIEVKGEQYNNVMAKFDYLKDKDIADVLSYVRSNFGNDEDAVTINEVKVARSEGAG